VKIWIGGHGLVIVIVIVIVIVTMRLKQPDGFVRAHEIEPGLKITAVAAASPYH
jgi:hypothetical protein